jgi:hypothetical protein
MALPHNARYSDCSSGHIFSSNPRTRSHRPGCADWSPVDALNVPSQSLQPALHDAFFYYKALLNTDILTDVGTNELLQHDDSHANSTDPIGAQEPERQQCRVRAIPSHLAVRFANRSNGGPLATIIEQGSHSTLNSCGSLLSAGRFTSMNSAETSSPDRVAHRVSQSLERVTVDHSQENTPQTHLKTLAMEASAILQDDGPVVDGSTPMEAIIQQLPQSPRSQISDADPDRSDIRPRDFFRGVLRNVRAVSWTRSRSSSLTQTPVIKTRDGRPPTSGNSLLCQPHGEHHHLRQGTCLQNCEKPNMVHGSLAAPSTPVLNPQTTNRKTLITNRPNLAPTSTCQPSHQSSVPLLERSSTSGPVAAMLAPSVAGPSREQPCSVRLVPPEPRDVADVAVTTGASKRCNDSKSAQHTFYGVSADSDRASSLHRHDCAKEPSHNASFCSTLSTSYSGTVLGVDLDLQFKTPDSVQHSSSPMPV